MVCENSTSRLEQDTLPQVIVDSGTTLNVFPFGEFWFSISITAMFRLLTTSRHRTVYQRPLQSACSISRAPKRMVCAVQCNAARVWRRDWGANVLDRSGKYDTPAGRGSGHRLLCDRHWCHGRVSLHSRRCLFAGPGCCLRCRASYGDEICKEVAILTAATGHSHRYVETCCLNRQSSQVMIKRSIGIRSYNNFLGGSLQETGNPSTLRSDVSIGSFASPQKSIWVSISQSWRLLAIIEVNHAEA